MGPTPESHPDGENFERRKGVLLSATDAVLAKSHSEVAVGAQQHGDKSLKEKAVVSHPNQVIPHLTVRILGFRQAWAPEFWSLNPASPLGHGLKNFTSACEQHYFSGPMLSCVRKNSKRATAAPLSGAVSLSSPSNSNKADGRAVEPVGHGKWT